MRKLTHLLIIAAFLFLFLSEKIVARPTGRTIANYIMEVPDSSTHKKAYKGAAVCFLGGERALVGMPGINNGGLKASGASLQVAYQAQDGVTGASGFRTNLAGYKNSEGYAGKKRYATSTLFRFRIAGEQYLGDMALGKGGSLVAVPMSSSGKLDTTMLPTNIPANKRTLEGKGAWAHDLDGDGTDEILLGSPKKNELRWYSIFRTVSDSIIFTEFGAIEGSSTLPRNAGFGAAITGMDDVDSDGNVDIAVGLPGVNRVAILLLNHDGSAKSESYISLPTGAVHPRAELGYALATIPDFTGDGVREILAGAPGINDVFILSAVDSLIEFRRMSNLLEMPNLGRKDRFGSALAVKDNGDTPREILVGAEGASTIFGKKSGTVYLVQLFSMGAPETVVPKTESFSGGLAPREEVVGPLIVSPNPTSGLVKYQLDEPAEITVFDSQGRELLARHVGPSETINLSGHPLGMYFFSINKGGKSYTQRVVLVE